MNASYNKQKINLSIRESNEIINEEPDGYEDEIVTESDEELEEIDHDEFEDESQNNESNSAHFDVSFRNISN